MREENIKKIKKFFLNELNLEETQIDEHTNHDLMIKCHRPAEWGYNMNIFTMKISIKCLDCKEIWEHSIRGNKKDIVLLNVAIDIFLSQQNEIARLESEVYGKEKVREPREKNHQVYDRKSNPERSKLLKEPFVICPNCFRKIDGDVIPRHIFCKYCGAKLKSRFILKEKNEKVFNNSKSQNFEKLKLNFCDECGQLMFPHKIGNNFVVKCKCGFTKPISENMTSIYKITTKVTHSFKEESIYRSFCGEKFHSRNEFLNHPNTCQKCKNHNNELRIIEKRIERGNLRKQRAYTYLLAKEEIQKKDVKKQKVAYYCVCGVQFRSEASYLEHRKTSQSVNSVNNSEIRVLFQKGIKYRKIGEYQEAIDCFKKILTINPHVCDVIMYLKLLESM